MVVLSATIATVSMTSARGGLMMSTMPRQRLCCVCGQPRTDAHHPTYRSQGGYETVELCRRCHDKAHDGFMRFEETDGVWHWIVEIQPGVEQWARCKTDSEWENLDEPSPEIPPEFDQILALYKGYCWADWQIGRLLRRLTTKMGRPSTIDYIIQVLDLHPQSAGSWFDNRVMYGSLTAQGCERLGVTRGVKIAKMLTRKGWTQALETAMVNDALTMPVAQFEAKYG